MAHRLGVHSSCASGVHGLHENAARERDAVPGSLLRSGGPTPVLDLTNYYILTQKLPKTAASSRSTPAPDPRPFLAPPPRLARSVQTARRAYCSGPSSAYAVPAAYMPWQTTRGAPTAHGANDGHRPGAISGAIWRDLARSQPDLSPRRTAPPTACCDRSRRRPGWGLGLGLG